MLKKLLGTLFIAALFVMPFNTKVSADELIKVEPEMEQFSKHNWSISDRRAGVGQPYLISEGTINRGPLNIVYDGYASVVWPGGYAANVTMYVTATASTTYLDGSTTASSDNTTRIANGNYQTLGSVPVNFNHNGLYATGTRVFSRGTIESTNTDWFYYSFTGSGNHGV